MSEQNVVNRGIAIALGILSILLLIGLAGTLVYFPTVISERETEIRTLTAQKDLLGEWLDGNMSLLQAAMTERGSIEAKLDNPQYGLPGIQSNFTSVLAALNASQLKPALEIDTVAEDDPIRQTGLMVLGVFPAGTTPGVTPGVQPGSDLIAHYRITTTYNGVPVTPGAVFMMVLQEGCVNPPSTVKQFSREILTTKLTDVSSQFVCMYRTTAPGVGVLDVYYIGPLDKEYVANYIVVISAYMRIGHSVVWGTDLQSLCILGYSMDSATGITTLPDGSNYYAWFNPLGAFTSCDVAVFCQRIWLGLPVPQS